MYKFTDVNSSIDYIKSYIKDNCYMYKDEKFKLSAGGESHHYFNLRKLTYNPEFVDLLCEILNINITILKSRNDSKVVLAGLTMGADPIIFSMCAKYESRRKSMPYLPLIVRKVEKSHGAGGNVEYCQTLVDASNDDVFIIDDVTTSGSSTLKVVEALRNINKNVNIKGAISILDREEGAENLLKEHKVSLYSIYKKSDFGVGD